MTYKNFKNKFKVYCLLCAY